MMQEKYLIASILSLWFVIMFIFPFYVMFIHDYKANKDGYVDNNMCNDEKRKAK